MEALYSTPKDPQGSYHRQHKNSYSHRHAKYKGMNDAPPGATHLAKQSTGGLSTARHSFTDTEQEA